MRHLIILFVLLFLVVAVFAQDDTALVDGLNAPRGLYYDADGNLWIVEAGQGGSLTGEGAFGPVDVGGSGALKMLSADGDLVTVMQNLPSQGPAGQARGAQAVMVTEDSIWLLIGETPHDFPLSHALIEIDRASLRIKTHVDLYSIEAELNPDGDIISSNPVDFVRTEDGTFYISNAGCNCILSWAAGGEVEIFTSWGMDDNPVPTGIALAPDGSLYIGFLSGFPFDEGSSRIEQWSTDGTLLNTFGDLTALSDVFVTPDGSVYAVSLGVFGDLGFENGKVLRVSADGAEVMLEGLVMPWGLALAPDGSLVVSVDSTSDNGAVIAVPMS
jgi:sugar lactone lactonase YvrE